LALNFSGFRAKCFALRFDGFFLSLCRSFQRTRSGFGSSRNLQLGPLRLCFQPRRSFLGLLASGL
jgi:hypothetical protein